MTGPPPGPDRGRPPGADSDADGSWVYALTGRGLGYAPASHPETIARTRKILGPGPVEWSVELGHQMSTRIIQEIPALGIGEDAFEILRPGPESAVLQSLMLVVLNDPTLSGATPEALEGDRDFVRRGIPLDQVLHGIRLGHSLMASGMLAAVADLVKEPAATAEMKRVSELLFEFIDEFASMMTSEYLVERDRWVASAAAARSEVVQAILGDGPVELSAAAATLSYPLELSHVALVIAQVGDVGPAITALQNAAAQMLARLGCAATLLVPQGASKLWAWGARRSFPDELPAMPEAVDGTALDVGIGGPANGITGFRQSHAEAVRAAALVDSATRTMGGRIVRYRDVELVALLAADVEMARAFVSRELGPLADRSRASNDLRRTLMAYLDTERSLMRAAERLHIARNTVAYRVRKAEDLLQRDLRERTTELQCALRLAAMLPAQLLTRQRVDGRR
jgi:PucR C-terminal helix-turn-helix domain/GGDEF-like domain